MPLRNRTEIPARPALPFLGWGALHVRQLKGRSNVMSANLDTSASGAFVPSVGGLVLLHRDDCFDVAFAQVWGLSNPRHSTALSTHPPPDPLTETHPPRSTAAPLSPSSHSARLQPHAGSRHVSAWGEVPPGGDGGESPRLGSARREKRPHDTARPCKTPKDTERHRKNQLARSAT